MNIFFISGQKWNIILIQWWMLNLTAIEDLKHTEEICRIQDFRLRWQMLMVKMRYVLILYLSKHFIYIISSAYISDISKAVLNLMLGISATPSRSQLWIISYSSLALFVALLLPNTWFTNVQLYNCQICIHFALHLHCTW